MLSCEYSRNLSAFLQVVIYGMQNDRERQEERKQWETSKNDRKKEKVGKYMKK